MYDTVSTFYLLDTLETTVGHHTIGEASSMKTKTTGTCEALLALLIGSMLMAGSGTAPAQPQRAGPPPELTIAVPITDSVFALPYIAEVNGYFKDAGVKVNFVNAAGANVLNLVAAGQADVTFFGTALSFSMVAQGKPTSVIYNFSGGGLGGMVMANKPYKDLTELGGKRIGTVGVNGSSYGYAQSYSQYSQKNGAAKFEIVPFNDPTTLVNSLKSGQIDAGVGPEGWFAAAAKDGGLHIVVDTKNPNQRAKFVGGYFAENSMFGMTDSLKAKRSAVVRYLRGIDKARSWIGSHSPEEIAALLVQKAGPFKSVALDAQVTSAKYTYHFWTPVRGRISKEMWNASLPRFALWNLQGVDVSRPEFAYEQRVDMSYLDEAVKQ